MTRQVLIRSCFIFALAQTAAAQEALVPLNGNPRQLIRHELPRSQVAMLSARVQTVMLELPFKEDFHYASFSPVASADKWEESGAFINTGFPVNPPSAGVATFDGLNKAGYPYDPDEQNMNLSRRADTLTSKPINLQVAGTQTLLPSDSIGLIFFYQARGYGDNPETNDSLMLDFYNPTDTAWVKKVWSQRGASATPSDTAFKRVFIRINDPEYLKPGFRFRFRNTATTSGDFDHWHVDYIYLNQKLANKDSLFDDVTFAYVPSSLLHEYSAMPFNHYRTSEMTNNMRVKIRYNGGATASMSYDHKVYQGGIATSYSYSGGPDNLPSYYTGGYSDWPAHSNFNPAASYSLAVPGTDSTDFTIKHYLSRNDQNSTEFFRENDTLLQFLRFRNYFAYDDGSAEAGYYVNGPGARMAVRFRVNETDTLRGVRIFFNPSGAMAKAKNFGFRILIWEAGNSGPAALQHSFATVYKQTYFDDGFRAFPEFSLDTPVVLAAGHYFIGVQQQADNIVIGFDRNYDAHEKLWYNIGQSWIQSSIPGSLMLRPVMGKKVLAPVDVQEYDNVLFNVYPNPANERVVISGRGSFRYMFSDAAGQKLREGIATDMVEFDTSQFSEGLYMITLSTEKGTQVRKLIISR